jgi:hypothetical protein
MPTAADDLDDTAPVLALYPAGVPLTLSQFLNPNDSMQQWLTAVLPLVLPSTPDKTQGVQPVPIPVVTANSRKSKNTGRKTSAGTLGTTPKTPRKRSSHKPSAAL